MNCAPARSAIAASTSLLVVLLAGPLAAQSILPDADWRTVHGELEAGAVFVTGDSARFGRHTGRDERGLVALLDLDWLTRAPDGGDGVFRVQVGDAGLDARSASVLAGRQGRFRLAADYQRIPFRQDAATRTPFNLAEPARLTLPDDWQPAPTTAGMGGLEPALAPVALGHDRRRGSLGLAGWLSRHWDVEGRYSQDKRSGYRPVAGLIGNTGGNPRVAMLPGRTDYTTRQFELGANYADDARQLSLGWTSSLFENDHPSLAWTHPFSAIAGWHPDAGYPAQGQVSRPPDNQFHQLRAAGGWSFSPRTRLTADVALGRMTQDETFLPLTVNPDVAATITAPLPRASLDGQIDTTAVNLRLAATPHRRLNLNLDWRFDDRDNRTPIDEFVTLRGDSEAQNAALASSRRRFNLPYDYREQRFGLSARYRAGDGSRWTGRLERKRVERSYGERERVTENRAELGWNRNFGARLSAGARLEAADRDGSTYDGANDLRSGFAPEYADTVAGGWINPPGLRQYHLADRRRHRGALSLQFTPDADWSLGLEAARSRDEYRNSELGLTGADHTHLVGHLSWNLAANWQAHLFHARDRSAFDQAGRSIRGGPNKLPDSINPDHDWFVDQRDRAAVTGAGIEWQRSDGRLRVRADHVHVDARSRIRVDTGPALESAALPRVESRTHNFRLDARYRLREDLALRLDWLAERYRGRDFAFDGVPVDQLANLIGLGETVPRHFVHVIGASVIWTF